MQVSEARATLEGGWLLSLSGLRLDARFEVLQRMGAGSYSEIYFARDSAPGAGDSDDVVVKALNPLLYGDVEPDIERTLLENFGLEGQVLSAFDHPNIVALRGSGEAEDRGGRTFRYLVLEYLEGGNLSRLCRARPLPLEHSFGYLRHVCAALDYSHANGVIHRDVKPGNVLLAGDGRTAKLIDFGTGRRLSSGGAVTQVGTHLYAAPEHYSRPGSPKEALTFAADVYGLAKTWYFVLTGESPSNFTQRRITSLPPHLSGESWVAEALRVLGRATDDDPAARYQSVRDFFEELSAASELTVLGPRGAAPRPRPRGRSKVVVEVKPAVRHDWVAELKALSGRYGFLLLHAAGVASRYCLEVLAAAALLARRRLSTAVSATASVVTSLARWLPKPSKALPAVPLGAVLLLTFTLVLLNQGAADAPRGAGPGVGTVMAVASTDVNIRSAPGAGSQRVGLAERGSLVRILSCEEGEKWCEIEVLQHGRPKSDAESADHGWVREKYFRKK